MEEPGQSSPSPDVVGVGVDPSPATVLPSPARASSKRSRSKGGARRIQRQSQSQGEARRIQRQSQSQGGTGGSTQIFVQRDLGEIQNFVDATEAGGINSHLCTLILIEGRSASSFVTTGLTGILKRKWYGSYSFIGNFINPRTASVKEVQNNNKAQELVTILGLQSEKHYENVSELRYGKIIIMTDQDVDGMHIKGLVINFFHTYWPSLLGVNSFMSQPVTPLIKVAIPCSKGVIQFESVQSYETWRRNVGRRILGTWRSTYYKGLGNHGYEGSRFYLQNLNNHTRAFLPLSKDDGEWIEMVFSPKKVEERKNWILKQEPECSYEGSTKPITYQNFVNVDLLEWAKANSLRTISSVVDGFKPVQRKIMFCCLNDEETRNGEEISVTSLSSKVSALTSYHHGANCVEKTITLMCQNFVGKRNINLLAPMGMFGTRYKGGKDHASPRYTFTKLGTLTRKIFVPADDRLSYTDECDRTIEPKWLLPIIPMVLVNGTTGVGSGWNSNVPQYNPTCIIRNLKHLLHEQKPVPMEPSYRGFKGSLKKISTGYELHGKIEIVDDHTLRITELPIGYSTEKFKSELFEHMSQKQPCVEKSVGKNGITVEEVQDNCTGDEIDFLVTLTKENMTLAKQMGLVAAFNLRTKVNTNNMHLYNGKGIITKFETAEQILEEFVKLRLPFYVTRKEQELQSIERMITEDRNRLKYISALLNGEFDAISLNGEELSKRGFDPCVRDKDPSTYEYLIIGMARNVNIGARKMLEQQIDRLKETCESLRKISAKEIWLRDLTILEHEIALQDKKLKSREDCCAGDIIGSSASSSPESERRPMKSKLKPNTEVDVECTIPGDALIQVSPRPVTRSQSACNSPTCSLVAPLTFPRRRRRRQLSPAIPLGGLIPLPVSQASPGPITRRHDLNQEITELPQDIATMESMQETQMGGNCRQEGGLATAQDTKVLDSVRAVLTSWPRRLNWHTVLKLICLSDLEFDYINPYDSSSRINAVVCQDPTKNSLKINTLRTRFS